MTLIEVLEEVEAFLELAVLGRVDLVGLGEGDHAGEDVGDFIFGCNGLVTGLNLLEITGVLGIEVGRTGRVGFLGHNIKLEVMEWMRERRVVTRRTGQQRPEREKGWKRGEGERRSEGAAGCNPPDRTTET